MMSSLETLQQRFRLNNILDTRRKFQIVFEVGLKPHQVAVWFKDQLARQKHKRLEEDVAKLKSEVAVWFKDRRTRRKDKHLEEDVAKLKSDVEVWFKDQLARRKDKQLEEDVAELEWIYCS
ncbi:hypothetical protein R6Q59_002440 [Mikania micrantha]